jgi:von Willebrand factor A domain-containing protein 7
LTHSLMMLISISFTLMILQTLPYTVVGFFPTKWKEVAFGFGGMSHVEMTEKAFEDRAAAYFPLISPITRKMIKARDEVADANADVDDNQVDAHWHCDGESFEAARDRITLLKTQAIDALQGLNNAALARHRIGEALHTIQDFYAHSNWVELGNSAPNSDLIRGNPMTFASFSTPTCRECAVQDGPVDPLTGIPSAFCSNWICDHNTDGFNMLTSGYYFGENVPPAGTSIPPFKCHHGK